MSTTAPEKRTFATVLDERTLDAGYSGRMTITRVRSSRPEVTAEMVFVESSSNGLCSLMLTQVQAADLADVLKEISGMASCTYDAEFLAEAVSDALSRRRVTKAAIMRATGIGRRRLAAILGGNVPMTRAELKLISNLGPDA